MSASRKGMGRGSIGSDLAKVDAYQNNAADYEELPEVTDEEFARATVHVGGVPVRGRPPLGERPKKQVTLRLDQDVLEHFRGRGPGWQGRINAVLRKSIGTAEFSGLLLPRFAGGGSPRPDPLRRGRHVEVGSEQVVERERAGPG